MENTEQAVSQNYFIIDCGLLTVCKKEEDILAANEDEIEQRLKGSAEECANLLIDKLINLPSVVIDSEIVRKLPDPIILLPRTKPLPKIKSETRWEKFAKAKGIKSKKRSSKKWDEVTKEFKPRFGSHRADATDDKWIIETPHDHQIGSDPFDKMKNTQKENIARNQFSRIKNVQKSIKNQKPYKEKESRNERNNPFKKPNAKKHNHQAFTNLNSEKEFALEVLNTIKTKTGINVDKLAKAQTVSTKPPVMKTRRKH